MPMIGILLSRYWKPLALVLLIAAALAYRAILIHQRDGALAKVTQLTAEAAALRASNLALGATIDRQNAAVAQLKATADAASSAMTSRAETASRQGAAAQDAAAQQARALMAAPIAAGSAGCLDAIKWGNAQAAELASW
jgi:hypothetical protein